MLSKLSTFRPRLLSIVFAGLVTATGQAIAAIPSSERAVLLSLYTSTNGPGWVDRTNWNGPPGTECTWYGVRCDSGEAHVQEIVLQTNRLVGELPPLSSLTYLETFLVNNDPVFPENANRLSGPLPSLTGLALLRNFSADDNQFTGQIPSLAGLTSLSVFAARNNRLTGPIPPLAGLTRLYALAVEDNELTGSIPSLAGLGNLWGIVVSGNQLTGSLPSLSGLTNLEAFIANGNRLSGGIPPLAGLPKLRRLWIHDNELTGSMPSLAGLTALRDIDVANNRLTGNVPTVPSPNGLTAGASRLCPNFFNQTPDPSWDAAIGTAPWYSRCTPEPASFSGPTATGSGIATAIVSCTGTPSCNFSKSAWTAPPGVPGSPPVDAVIAGVSFPNGLFDFVVTGGSVGFSATLTLTFPQPLPVGTAYYKFGPTPDDRAPHWYQLPATISGNSVTFTIVDGMLGDDDLVADGSISDPGGAASTMVTVVEYYHDAFDHYFITAKPDEVAKLDNGTFVGWARTGLTFNAYSRAATGGSSVCRFFSTAFEPKSSHFYTPFANECTTVKANPNWQFEAEGDDTFYSLLAAGDGSCAGGSAAIYRLFNDGRGGAPNHRYTTDASVRDLMISKGWVLEGNGPGLAFMCAPPATTTSVAPSEHSSRHHPSTFHIGGVQE